MAIFLVRLHFQFTKLRKSARNYALLRLRYPVVHLAVCTRWNVSQCTCPTRWDFYEICVTFSLLAHHRFFSIVSIVVWYAETMCFETMCFKIFSNSIVRTWQSFILFGRNFSQYRIKWAPPSGWNHLFQSEFLLYHWKASNKEEMILWISIYSSVLFSYKHIENSYKRSFSIVDIRIDYYYNLLLLPIIMQSI